MSIYIYFLVFSLLVGTCNDKQTALEFQLEHESTSPFRVGEKHPIFTILLSVGDFHNDSDLNFGEDASDFDNHSNVIPFNNHRRMGQEGFSDKMQKLSAGGELKAHAYADPYYNITMIILMIIFLTDGILLLTLGSIDGNPVNDMRKIRYVNELGSIVILYTSIWMQITFPNPNVVGLALLVGLFFLLGVSLPFLRLRYDFGLLDFVINMGSQYCGSEFLHNKYAAIPCFLMCCVVMVVRNHLPDITIYIITRFPTNGQEIVDGTGGGNQHNGDSNERGSSAREQDREVRGQRGIGPEEIDAELGGIGRDLNQGVTEAALNPGMAGDLDHGDANPIVAPHQGMAGHLDRGNANPIVAPHQGMAGDMDHGGANPIAAPQQGMAGDMDHGGAMDMAGDMDHGDANTIAAPQQGMAGDMDHGDANPIAAQNPMDEEVVDLAPHANIGGELNQGALEQIAAAGNVFDPINGNVGLQGGEVNVVDRRGLKRKLPEAFDLGLDGIQRTKRRRVEEMRGEGTVG